jgi:hypothetical protein
LDNSTMDEDEDHYHDLLDRNNVMAKGYNTMGED